jgi:hypothetical protein
MTVKNVYLKDTSGNHFGWANVQDTHGGQEIHINLTHELAELTRWWQEWGPIFSSGDPRVVDALLQAKTMHTLTREAR